MFPDARFKTHIAGPFIKHQNFNELLEKKFAIRYRFVQNDEIYNSLNFDATQTKQFLPADWNNGFIVSERNNGNQLPCCATKYFKDFQETQDVHIGEQIKDYAVFSTGASIDSAYQKDYEDAEKRHENIQRTRFIEKTEKNIEEINNKIAQLQSEEAKLSSMIQDSQMEIASANKRIFEIHQEALRAASLGTPASDPSKC